MWPLYYVGTYLLAATAPTTPSTILDINPNQDSAHQTIPLVDTIIKAVSGLGWLALVAALAGLLISAALWAIGSYSNNFQQTINGKRGVAVSAAAALIIGLAKILVNRLYFLGSAAS